MNTRIWLLTNTTYGSWLPGDSRGSVTSVRERREGEPDTAVRTEHDIPGELYEDAIPGLEASARDLMTGEPVYLDVEGAVIAVNQFRETVSYRGWVLRAVAVMSNHFTWLCRCRTTPTRGKCWPTSRRMALGR